jgi:hypothetical protein
MKETVIWFICRSLSYFNKYNTSFYCMWVAKPCLQYNEEMCIPLGICQGSDVSDVLVCYLDRQTEVLCIFFYEILYIIV